MYNREQGGLLITGAIHRNKECPRSSYGVLCGRTAVCAAVYACTCAVTATDIPGDGGTGYLSYRATQWACMVIETGAAAAVQVTEAILSRPAVPAATLVAFALLAPSIAAAGERNCFCHCQKRS
jgi:hypothetical protein